MLVHILFNFYPLAALAAHLSYDCPALDCRDKGLRTRKNLVTQIRDEPAVQKSSFKSKNGPSWSSWSDFERVSKGGIGAFRRRDMQSQLGERRLRRRQTGLVIRETGTESSEGGEGRGHFRWSGGGGATEAIGKWGVSGQRPWSNGKASSCNTRADPIQCSAVTGNRMSTGAVQCNNGATEHVWIGVALEEAKAK